MLRYVISFVKQHTEHPYFAGLILLGAIFALAGVAVDLTLDYGLVAGFFIVYAIIVVAMGAVGYAAVISGKLVREYVRRTDPSL